MFWIIAAIFSAFFAGLTSILAKCGIKKTDSDLATAIRTIVVLIFSWVMVFIVGSQSAISEIKPMSFLFLVLSGLATGASWICYFKALSMGNINKVVPIDKSSTILTVLLAIICFGETSNLVVKLIATTILAVGIFLMVEKKKADKGEEGKGWMIYAVLAAVFAALTSILGKVGISGVESLVRNVAYMVMISRMVNVVGEQGTYWVANNFIWGWLLLPVLQLGELIKQETAADKENVRKNTLGYFGITAIVSVLWCASIPLWKPFMTSVLQFTDVDKLFELVLVLLGFYVLYAIQNVFDSVFYGLGKTNYMLFESVVTNTIYYGIAFVLYATGVWTPTLIGIALLFGIGNAFDSIVSLGAFAFLLKKEKINILNVE